MNGYPPSPPVSHTGAPPVHNDTAFTGLPAGGLTVGVVLLVVALLAFAITARLTSRR